jgi:type VI secretion system protein ImpL
MQKFLVQQGTEYVAKPSTPAATPAFVKFFNSAAQVSTAFFPNNAPQLQLAFSVRVNPAEDVQAVTLSLGAQSLRYSGGEAAQQSFTWPGSGPLEAKLRVKFTGGTDLDFPGSMGPWAVFHFFSHFEHWQTPVRPAPSIGRCAPATIPYIVPKSGRPATVSLVLDTGAAPDVFRPGYFAGLTCVAPAVR